MREVERRYVGYDYPTKEMVYRIKVKCPRKRWWNWHSVWWTEWTEIEKEMNNRNKTLEYYQGLQYRIELMRDATDPSEPVWFAKVFELPGCITEADTAEEATEMIQDAMTAWLETALEAGRAIPEPRPAENYS